MRHSCSSCVSGLVITSISLLSTSCFSIKRPPWPLTTTVSQVSRNFFPLWPRPCACTRILRNTRELRRGEAAMTSLIAPIFERPPSYRQSVPPDRCSPTATRRKTVNGHLCYERAHKLKRYPSRIPCRLPSTPFTNFCGPRPAHVRLPDCTSKWPMAAGSLHALVSFRVCNHTSRLVSQSPELVCGR